MRLDHARKELSMNTRDLTPAATHLRKGDILRLPHARGQRIEALHGGLWITIDHDLRDIVIRGGEGFTIDRDGDTLVSALDDASLVVLTATAPRG
jgi:hypothetical protein